MRKPSRPAALLTGLVLGLGLLSATAAAADDTTSDDSSAILRASVQGSLTTDPPLFGVNPGGAPWQITRGLARVSQQGDVAVDVRGLIIPTRGSNPVPALSASLACNGQVVATTSTVPFSPEGDAQIRAQVTVPERCLAPAVLLNPNGNPAVYIAVTGR
ncbi:MAG TPA: hypothetical protein VFJ22_20100 [Dermatophilaceae bacterium]|nr:hypothetical protein [Dermatophilaceae bacterium]